jgi:hypothetical protein
LFETLDSIDWASIEGNDGPVADMPHLLRSFLSEKNEHVRNAIAATLKSK